MKSYFIKFLLLFIFGVNLAKGEPPFEPKIITDFDGAITHKVLEVLDLDQLLNAVSVHVETKNGIVYLSGKVYREQEVTRIVQLTQAVPGVKGVNIAGIDIPNRNVNELSDTLITAKVRTILDQSQIFGKEPNSLQTIYPVTRNGVVYLNGTAENQEQMQKAVALVQAVSGVKAVVTNIKLLPDPYCCGK